MMRSAIVAMVSIFLVSEAQAQQPSAPEPPKPVVLLVYGAHDPFGLRLEGELRSIGVKVVTRSHLSHAVPAGTIAVARVFGDPRPRIEIRLGSHAGIDASGSHTGIDVEPDVLVEVGDTDEGLKTTKAAESVRAAIQLFVEAETTHPSTAEGTPEPPSDPAMPTRPARRGGTPPARPPNRPELMPSPHRSMPSLPGLTRPMTKDGAPANAAPAPRRLFSIAAGVSAVVGSQGTGFDVVSSAVVSPLSWLHFEPFVAIPFIPATLEGEAGSADLYAGMVGLRAGFTIVRESVLRLDVGGGFAGVWLRAVGEPANGYRGVTVDGFTTAALVDVTPRIHVYGGLALAPRISLGVALPPPELVFAGNNTGTWGAPFGEFSLSADIAVFP